MASKRTLRKAINPGGFCVAVAYVLIVIAMFLFTVATMKPSNLGLDVILLAVLTLPWYAINPGMLVPGFIINTGLMYLLGTLLYAVWQRITR